MCGRYTQTHETQKLKPRFGVDHVKVDTTARFNIAPTQAVPTVLRDADGVILDAFRWGLLPAWAKSQKGSPRPINAKIETVATSGMFKRLLTRRRCIVPADSWFEWIGPEGHKRPVRFLLKSGEIFGFAALWDAWKDPANPDAEPLRTCTILTDAANAAISPMHDRMPVILTKENEARWLDPSINDAQSVLALCTPIAAELLDFHPVGTQVNNARNEGPELIRKLEPSPEVTEAQAQLLPFARKLGGG